MVGRMPDERATCRWRRTRLRRQRRTDRSTSRKRRQRAMAPPGTGPRGFPALGCGLADRADRAGPAARDACGRRRNPLAEGFRIAVERCPPAPAGDRLYLPLKDGRVVALSLQAGEEIWTHKFAESAAGILPVGDRVFIGGRDNQFHSLSAEDADADWRWPTGADLLGLPVLDDKRVYFIALDNVLRGHNRNNGTMDVEAGASGQAIHRSAVERRDADRVWRRRRVARLQHTRRETVREPSP